MILPQSYNAVLLLMVLSLLCLGSWASAFKFAGTWRFELFYLDFALGLFVASAIVAFTVGNPDTTGSTSSTICSTRASASGCTSRGGLIFNFGNMLLMARYRGRPGSGVPWNGNGLLLGTDWE
jgi:glucose uptake protein